MGLVRVPVPAMAAGVPLPTAVSLRQYTRAIGRGRTKEWSRMVQTDGAACHRAAGRRRGHGTPTRSGLPGTNQ